MKIHPALLTIPVLCACLKPAPEFTENRETKPEPLANGTSENAIGRPETLMHASYLVTMKKEKGVVLNAPDALCTGRIQLTLLPDRTTGIRFEGGNSRIRCFNTDFDLAPLFNAFRPGAGGSGENDPSAGISVQDGVVFVERLGGFEFLPPRPLILSPILQRPIASATRLETRQTIARSQKKSASGTITFQLAPTTWSEPVMIDGQSTHLRDLASFRFTAQGFVGIQHLDPLLFEDFQVTMQYRPIVLAGIRARCSPSFFVGTTSTLTEVASAALDALLGTLSIELKVEEWRARD